MKSLYVINSLCMDRHVKVFRKGDENFRWDYTGLIQSVNASETLFFHVSAPSENKGKFLQVLDIEYGVQLVSAPVNNIEHNCPNCDQSMKQFEYSLYNTTLAAITMAKVFQWGIDQVFFLGLDRPETSLIRELRKQGIGVLGETFERLNNIAMKANCNLGITIIDQQLENYVVK